MKKHIVTGFVILLTTAATAQQSYFQVGVNMANTSVTANGTVDDTRALTSFNIGFMSAFNLSRVVDFETGFLISGKGAKEEIYYGGSTTDNYSKRSINPVYAEIPLNLVVRIPFDKKNSLNVFGGPYAAVGLFGKVKGDTRFLGVGSSFSNNIEYNNDDPFTSQQEGASSSRLRRFDTGLNLGASFELEHVIIKANYGLGLSKISSVETNTNDKNKHRVISLSVGFTL